MTHKSAIDQNLWNQFLVFGKLTDQHRIHQCDSLEKINQNQSLLTYSSGGQWQVSVPLAIVAFSSRLVITHCGPSELKLLQYRTLLSSPDSIAERLSETNRLALYNRLLLQLTVALNNYVNRNEYYKSFQKILMCYS